MTKNYRIALGSIFTECNHLVGGRMDLSWFERTELRRGPEILDARAGVVGGALDGLRGGGASVVPLLVASSVPGPPLTLACYRSLKEELLARLAQAVPVDGVLLPLHGAAAVEELGDLEGDLLEAVRQFVGRSVPIVATLDLHADVTAKMVRFADALLAWETYPHRDTFQTGRRGANMLLDILNGKVKPTMAMAKVPVIVGGVNGHTEGEGPFADVMRLAKSYEGKEGVVSSSVFLVCPYLDLPDMGGGTLFITNGDMDKAVALSSQLALEYWNRRFDLEPEVYTPAEAIRKGMDVAGGPVLLVEAADCCGGGASGDSVVTLRALLDVRVDRCSFVPVVDPEAAARCHHAGAGTEVMLALGHKLDPQWGHSLDVTGKVLGLSDGRFRYTGGIWEGQEGDMGPSATVQIGSVVALIMSCGTYDWADEQFRAMGMEVSRAKFVVVKNPMNFRLGYAGMAKGAFVLDTPGPTPAVLHHVDFQRLQRPYFPKDADIPNLSPTILRR